MKLNVTITGQMPRLWREALDELRNDLGFVPSENGIPVRCRKGDGIAVDCDGSSVELTWGADVEFYRALSLIPVPLAVCHIREKANFQSAGPMFDCSRNGVVNPDAMRFFIRKMALMGLKFLSQPISVLRRAQGAHLLMEPKATTRPSGREKSRVMAKSSVAFPRPSSRLIVTVQNIGFSP